MSPKTTIVSLLLLPVFVGCNSAATKTGGSGNDAPAKQGETQTASAAGVSAKTAGGDDRQKPVAKGAEGEESISKDILRPGDPRFDCGKIIKLNDVQTACNIPYAIVTHTREGSSPNVACWRRFSGPKDERLSIIVSDFGSPEAAKNHKHPDNAKNIAPSEGHDEGYT